MRVATLHRAKIALLVFVMTSTLLVAAQAPQRDNAPAPAEALTAAQTPVPVATQPPVPVAAQASVPTAAQTPVPVAAQAPVPVAAQALAPVAAQIPAASGIPVALPTRAVPVVDPNEIRITGIGGKGSTQWTIVVLLTFLTLIPSLLLCMTPFARLLVVFHFLRQALGLQTTPSNQTLIGLALVLTFFLMQPVGATIYQTSVMPLQEGHISAMQALERGAVPVRQFMLHYVREKDVALFVELSKEPRPRDPNDLSLRVIAPAYILSELRMGFQIGTVLFLPFLVIDMVVASISTSVGMLQLPPVVISTPLKLLLFVMVDGWNLLIGSLMRSFN
jgi:flagellar biosynthetic protein FliP